MMLAASMQSILAVGGSLVVNCQGLLPQTMQSLAAVAKTSGGHITFTNCGAILAQTMQSIAAVGRGAVTFDLTR